MRHNRWTDSHMISKHGNVITRIDVSHELSRLKGQMTGWRDPTYVRDLKIASKAACRVAIGAMLWCCCCWHFTGLLRLIDFCQPFFRCMSVCNYLLIAKYLQSFRTDFDEFFWTDGPRTNRLDFGGDRNQDPGSTVPEPGSVSVYRNFYCPARLISLSRTFLAFGFVEFIINCIPRKSSMAT